MRDLSTPAPPGENSARIARLTRHLKARLQDFGPGGPELLRFSERQGMVSVRLPGRSGEQCGAYLLQHCGISTAHAGDALVFYLNHDIQFEDLDYVWGCLFDLLAD